MQTPFQWQIRTPMWVWLAAGFVLLLTALILVFHNFLLFLCAALALILYGRHSAAQFKFAQGVLHFEQGRWIYVPLNGSKRRVSLERVWPNGLWTTLRFTQEASGANQIMEFTVWKSSVSKRAWRALGMLVAQHVASAGGGRERA